MNIQILKHFIIIANSESINDASIKYQITQSNLSRSLRLLEQHVGAQLYHRHHKNTGLTTKGRSVYQKVLQLVETYNETIKSIQSIHTKEKKFYGFYSWYG